MADQTAAPRFHIPSLDGIRAVAFFTVFVGHAIPKFNGLGGFGVTVFFFLSGYLITTLLRREFDRTGHVDMRAFYLRRAWRIFPPFYAVLFVAIALALCGLLSGPIWTPGLLSELFYYNNYYAIYHGYEDVIPGTGAYWSLAVEEHFYVLFPLFYRYMRRRDFARRDQATWLVAISVAILVWRLVLWFGLHSSFARIDHGTDTRVDSLLFGCILATFGNPVMDESRWSENVWLYRIAPVAAAVVASLFLLKNTSWNVTFRFTVQGIALGALFVAAIRCPDRFPFRWLNTRWMRFAGVLSYSLYLVHGVIIVAVRRRLSPAAPILFPTALALTVLSSLAIYYTVETRAARVRRKLEASPGSDPPLIGLGARAPGVGADLSD